MQVTLVQRGSVQQDAWSLPMIAGLKRHGVDVQIIGPSAKAKTDVAICWGWKIGRRLVAAGQQVLVAERGYVGDRFYWTSLGWNGLNGRATFVVPEDDAERWERYFPGLLKPWRMDGQGSALFLAQVPGDQSVIDIPGGYISWLSDSVVWLRANYQDAVLRPHPKAPRIQTPLPRTSGTLDEDLRAAAFAYTFNSNSAVDAVLAGVPTFTADPGSVAYAVTGRHPSSPPVFPDRTLWARQLAWCQYDPEEIASGFAWDITRRFIS